MNEEVISSVQDNYVPQYESILSGKLPGSEIVIGMVGAVGSDLARVTRYIAENLGAYDYTVQRIKVSELISDMCGLGATNLTEPERTNNLMTLGDELRQTNTAILALAAVANINAQRSFENEKYSSQPRTVYLIDSLKHPDEVNVLRKIYGNGFFLMGIFVDERTRKENLIRLKDLSPSDAESLIARDTSEGLVHGQRTRDTFHLSDFFLHLDDEDEKENCRARNALTRIFEVLFSNPYATPLFDEYAMFMAFAAATRSADLSRQIGAVIADDHSVLASGANECPRYGGGTYWPFLDDSGHFQDCQNGRDWMRGHDSNDDEKSLIVSNAVDAARKSWSDAGKELSEDEAELLREALASSMIDDITEYGRVVHAEMAALLTCARCNISCKGATLYTITFPCHNCAKHIVAAGIERVVYIEPYPKSRAYKFHDDSVYDGFKNDEERGERVAFEPFVGIGPRRFFDLFSMKHGSGFPLKRKDSGGKVLPWEPEAGTIRIPMSPLNYLEREAFAVKKYDELTKGLRGGSKEAGSRADSNYTAADEAND